MLSIYNISYMLRINLTMEFVHFSYILEIYEKCEWDVVGRPLVLSVTQENWLRRHDHVAWERNKYSCDVVANAKTRGEERGERGREHRRGLLP